MSLSALGLPERLESLFRHFPLQLNEMLGENPRAFWESVDPADPKFQLMADITAIDGWMGTTHPCILHGDGGVCTKRNQNALLVVSVKSLLSSAFDANRFPGFVLPKGVRTHGEESDAARAMWESYTHDSNACWGGVHPHKDHKHIRWPE
eukprot:362808-Pyramimonas_sp.AAC.1